MKQKLNRITFLDYGKPNSKSKALAIAAHIFDSANSYNLAPASICTYSF